MRSGEVLVYAAGRSLAGDGEHGSPTAWATSSVVVESSQTPTISEPSSEVVVPPVVTAAPPTSQVTMPTAPAADGRVPATAPSPSGATGPERRSSGKLGVGESARDVPADPDGVLPSTGWKESRPSSPAEVEGRTEVAASPPKDSPPEGKGSPAPEHLVQGRVSNVYGPTVW